MKTISSGIIITDGEKILCGITPQRSYDIPKGKREEGENHFEAMERELKEETNLDLHKDLINGKLSELGFFKYNPKKDLFLFMYRTQTLPKIETLSCHSYWERSGKEYPEFIGYEYVSYSDIEKGNKKIGINMRRVLSDLKVVIAEGI